ncbi:MAG: Fibronectin type domain protein [Bacteroidetes bacterium]|jgi:hypothetical protein|nr:Fibronectin type domain protein [Bacteroidota bacterium]
MNTSKIILFRTTLALLIVTGLCKKSEAQSTLTFDQPFFTQNWVENSYTFFFDGNDDIRQYFPRNGAGHWYARGDMNAGHLGTIMNDIRVNGIYLYADNASDISNLIIRGYDETGSNVISSSILNPMSYMSYTYVPLNFTRVRTIKIEYTTGTGIGAIYADDMDYCPLPTVVTNPSNYVICTNGMSADFSITDFSAYNYQWQEDQGSGFANLSEAGIYTGTNTSALHISSATASMNNWHYRCIAMGGCSPSDTSSSADLIFTNFVTATLTSSTNVTCSGGNNGTALVTPGTFVAPPISYIWSYGGSTTNSATGLIDGAHTCIVFNGCSNSYTVSVPISSPLPLGATLVSQNDPTCYGYNNGEVSLNVSGGTAPYTMGWHISGSLLFTDNNQSHNDLPAGTPYIELTDVNGCTGSYTSYDLNNPPQVGGSIVSQTNVDCNGNANGSATVSGNGGDGGPYSYNWLFSGNTTDTESGLFAGTYSCSISDMTGCSYVLNVPITQPSPLSYSVGTVGNASCFNLADGFASFIGMGGAGGYTFSWAPSGATTSSATNLAAGTHTLTITDMNGCAVMPTATIFEPAEVLPNFSVTDVSCNGASDGAITTAATGGTGTLYYNWIGHGTNSFISGVPATSYNLEITDDNSCFRSFSTTVNEPAVLSTIINGTDVQCNGLSNGSATVTPSGGTPSYTYSWAPNGEISAGIINLLPGSYTVNVTDLNGCFTSNTVTINEPSSLLGAGSSTDALCFGATDGTASNGASGGVAPYTYLWAPSGQTTATATGLGAGVYTVTITDMNGCVITDFSTVNEPALLTAGIIQTDTACAGSNAGVAQVSATGGTLPHTFLWSSGGTGTTEGGLDGQPYTCTVTDNNGCIMVPTVNIYEFSTNITGHISTQSLPSVSMGSGSVYIFKYQPGAAGYDTVTIAGIDAASEYFAFNLDSGQYLVKAILNPATYPLAIPTYNGNAFQWDSSLVVNHGCVTNTVANIEVLELPVATGPGVVSGYVLEGDSFGVGARYNGHVGPIYPCVPGGPLKGIDVKLGKNPGGGIQARMMTDSTGKYEFTNLPLYGYKIYVDIPNLPMDSTREIILDATNNVSVQNNYYADSASVYVADTTIIPVGIYSSEKVYGNNFTVFPNPAKDRLSISFDLSKAGDVSIELTDALGQTILSGQRKNSSAGTFTHKLDIASLHLRAGVYFISVVNENKKYTQRLVVIE